MPATGPGLKVVPLALPEEVATEGLLFMEVLDVKDAVAIRLEEIARAKSSGGGGDATANALTKTVGIERVPKVVVRASLSAITAIVLEFTV